MCCLVEMRPLLTLRPVPTRALHGRAIPLRWTHQCSRTAHPSGVAASSAEGAVNPSVCSSTLPSPTAGGRKRRRGRNERARHVRMDLISHSARRGTGRALPPGRRLKRQGVQEVGELSAPRVCSPENIPAGARYVSAAMCPMVALRNSASLPGKSGYVETSAVRFPASTRLTPPLSRARFKLRPASATEALARRSNVAFASHTC